MKYNFVRQGVQSDSPFKFTSRLKGSGPAGAACCLIPLRGSTSHSGLAGRRQKVTSWMQRMHKLEKLIFQNKHLRKKGCCQPAPAGLSKQSRVPAPSAAIHSFRNRQKGEGGRESGKGKPNSCPIRSYSPMCATLTHNRHLNTQGQYRAFRWWVGFECTRGIFMEMEVRS